MKSIRIIKALQGFFCLLLTMSFVLPVYAQVEQDVPSTVETLEFRGWKLDLEFSGNFPSMLKGKILGDTGLYLRKSEVDDVLPLASYLNLLYSELDIVGSQSLTSAQMDQLFNLTFSLEEKQIKAQQTEQTVDEVALFLESFSEKLKSRYGRFDGCAFDGAINVDTDSSKAIATFQYLPLLDEEGVAVSCQESYLFAQDTNAQDDEERNIWVNHIKIIMPPEAQQTIDPVLAINAKEFIEEERKKATKYRVDGVEGFDEFDLLELADQVNKFYYSTSGGTRVSENQMKAFMDELLAPRSGRGVSFDELSLIADELKSFYRRNGLILTRIFIPEQDFSGAWGEISFSVVLGILSRVEVRNSEDIHYKPEVIISAFDEYIGESVTADIGEAYFYLNDMPGLSIQSGLFEPGENDGDTNLLLDVKENRWAVTLLADNYGTDLTGENRLIATVDWINPSGVGDLLKVGALYTSSPANATLGFLSYQVPIITSRLDYFFTFDNNIYEAQKEVTSGLPTIIKGETTNFSTGVNWKVKRSKDENMNFASQVFYKNSEADIEIVFADTEFPTSQKEESTGLTMTFAMDFLNRQLRSANNYDISLTLADYDYSAEPANNFDPSGSYSKISANFNSTTLIPLSKKDRSKFTAKVKLAYSGDSLPSYEQFPLGGPYAVKAYSTSTFVADTAAYVNVGWDFNVLDIFTKNRYRDHILDFGVFYETAYGELNPLEDDKDQDVGKVTLSGYGFYMRYDWKRSLVLDASISYAGSEKVEEPAFIPPGEEGEDNKLLISLRYTFD